MKRVLFSICLFILILNSCKSEQEKALELAVASNDLAVLRDFAANNSDMSESVRQKYTTALNLLMADSTLFEEVLNAGSIVEKYDAEARYLSAYPQGLHAEELTILLAEHKEAAEKIKNQFAEMHNLFNKYRFSLDDDIYEFDGPDESGKGTVKIKATPISAKVEYWTGYRLGRIERFCEGGYYVDDEGKIVLTINEKRSYKCSGNWDYGEEKSKELISDMKRLWPTPKPHKIILNITTDETGVKYLTGIDQVGYEIYFTPMVK